MSRIKSLLLLTLALACKGKAINDPIPDPATSWTVVPGSLSIAAGDTVTFQLIFFRGTDTLDIRDLTGAASVSSSEWTCDDVIEPCTLSHSQPHPSADFLSLEFSVVGHLAGSADLWLRYGQSKFVGCHVHPPDCFDFEEFLPLLTAPVSVGAL
jgi:hypothetical protein